MHEGCKMQEEDDDDETEFECTKILIVSCDNMILKYFNAFDTTCCLLSSYTYIWLAFFGADSYDRNLTLLFELIFTISIMLKFITTYYEEGNTQ